MSDREKACVHCPCCGFPTIGERAAFEICLVCWWEDDGQDDPEADEVWGGPNQDYSLTEARNNFRSHGHMYRKGDGIDVVERPSKARLELLAYVRDVQTGRKLLDLTILDRLLRHPKVASPGPLPLP